MNALFSAISKASLSAEDRNEFLTALGLGNFHYRYYEVVDGLVLTAKESRGSTVKTLFRPLLEKDLPPRDLSLEGGAIIRKRRLQPMKASEAKPLSASRALWEEILPFPTDRLVGIFEPDLRDQWSPVQPSALAALQHAWETIRSWNEMAANQEFTVLALSTPSGEKTFLSHYVRGRLLRWVRFGVDFETGTDALEREAVLLARFGIPVAYRFLSPIHEPNPPVPSPRPSEIGLEPPRLV